MAAKQVDIMEIRQLLLLKSKGESNRSCEKVTGYSPQYHQSIRSSVSSLRTVL